MESGISRNRWVRFCASKEKKLNTFIQFDLSLSKVKTKYPHLIFIDLHYTKS